MATIDQQQAELVQRTESLKTEAEAIQTRQAEADIEAARIQQRQQETSRTYEPLIKEGVFVGSKGGELEQAQETEAIVRRMGGDVSRFEVFRGAVQAQATQAQEQEYGTYQGEINAIQGLVNEWNRKQGTLSTDIEAYNLKREQLAKDTEAHNEQIKAYNKKQEEFGGYLQTVAEGKDLVQRVNIRTWYNTRRGQSYGKFEAIPDIKLPFQSESTSGEYQEYPTSDYQQELEKIAIERTKSYFGLGAEDIITLNGRAIQESVFTPEQIETANQVFSGKQTVLEQWERERELEQDRLKTEWLVSGRGSWAQPAAFTSAFLERFGSLPSNALIDVPKYNISIPQLEAQKRMLGSKDAVWSGIDAYETEARQMMDRVGTVTPEGMERFEFEPLTEISILPASERIAGDIQAKFFEGKKLSPTEQREFYKRGMADVLVGGQTWDMPDINPETGKRWSERDISFYAQSMQDLERRESLTEPAEEWFGRLSKHQKGVYGIGAFAIAPNILTNAIRETKFGGKPTEEGLIAQGLFGAPTETELKSAFQLESAKMGKEEFKYTMLEQNPLSYKEQLYLLQKERDEIKGIRGVIDWSFKKSIESPTVQTFVTVETLGGGLGLLSQKTPRLATALGYGAAGIGVADISYKTIKGDYAAAAIESSLFLASAPFAVHGYRAGASVKIPSPEGGYYRAMFGYPATYRESLPIPGLRPEGGYAKAMFGDTGQWIKSKLPAEPKGEFDIKKAMFGDRPFTIREPSYSLPGLLVKPEPINKGSKSLSGKELKKELDLVEARKRDWGKLNAPTNYFLKTKYDYSLAEKMFGSRQKFQKYATTEYERIYGAKLKITPTIFEKMFGTNKAKELERTELRKRTPLGFGGSGYTSPDPMEYFDSRNVPYDFNEPYGLYRKDVPDFGKRGSFLSLEYTEGQPITKATPLKDLKKGETEWKSGSLKSAFEEYKPRSLDDKTPTTAERMKMSLGELEKSAQSKDKGWKSSELQRQFETYKPRPIELGKTTAERMRMSWKDLIEYDKAKGIKAVSQGRLVLVQKIKTTQKSKTVKIQGVVKAPEGIKSKLEPFYESTFGDFFQKYGKAQPLIGTQVSPSRRIKPFASPYIKPRQEDIVDYDYSTVYPTHKLGSIVQPTIRQAQPSKVKVTPVARMNELLGYNLLGGQANIQANKMDLGLKSMLNLDITQITGIRQDVKVAQKQALKQLTKQVQRTRQRTEQRLRTPERTRTRTPTRTPKVPPIKPPKFGLGGSDLMNQLVGKGKKTKAWQVKNPFITLKNL